MDINGNLSKKRTRSQNSAMHLWFTMLAHELNTQGLDMRVVLKPEWQIWWTPEAVKENLWKPLQEAMYRKVSTTDLTTAQVDKVYEQIMKIIGERHGIHIDFPSQTSTEEYLNSYETKP